MAEGYLMIEIIPVKRYFPFSDESSGNVPKKAKWFVPLETSPPKTEVEKEAVLVLKQFSTYPRVLFNRVKVGQSRIGHLKVENPLKKLQEVSITKFPTGKGFSIESTTFTVRAKDCYNLPITWTPATSGNFRETVLFATNAGKKTQAYLLGIALSPPKKKKVLQRKVAAKTLGQKNVVPIRTKEMGNKNVPSFSFQNEEFRHPPARLSEVQNNGQLEKIQSPTIHGETYIVSPFKLQDAIQPSREVLNEIPSNSQCKSNAMCFLPLPLGNQRETYIKEECQENFYDSLEMGDIRQCKDPNLQSDDTTDFQNNFGQLGQIPEGEIKIPADEKATSPLRNTGTLNDLPEFDLDEPHILANDVVASSVKEDSIFVPVACKNETKESVAAFVPHSETKVKVAAPLVPQQRLSSNKDKKSVKELRFLKPKKATRVSNVSVARSKTLAKTSLPPSKLLLVKPESTVADTDMPRNPNPFATNFYYDERWMDKQESAYTCWLNFFLAPPDEINVSTDITPTDAARIWLESLKMQAPMKAPSKELMSSKSYTATCRLNQLRRASMQLYHSKRVMSVIRAVESEVENNKLVIRKDRPINVDHGQKKIVLEMIMSYQPLWLRIGLETIYGESIPMRDNKDISALTKFLEKRFLKNPVIASRYSSSKSGYGVALKKFVLKTFLILVYFLDCAKRSRLIDHDPCLFLKTSKMKSSREFLIRFSRAFLGDEKDVTKHLKQLGYEVTHQQNAIDEFDYAVSNLKIDLRCGLRLARVMELMLQNWNLSSSLKVPAISKLQKIRNNEVVLKAFIEAGYAIPKNISARDLVDGDREKTLTLLWEIIFQAQILKLLNVEELKKEIAYLKRSLQYQADVAAFDAMDTAQGKPAKESSALECQLYKENECLRLLLQWCQAVCLHYNITVCNFTTSFSDGRALCHLISHYDANILPLDKIQLKTTFTHYNETGEDGDDTIDFFNKQSEAELKPLLKNERKNLALAFKKFQEIGGIPVLPRPSDISNTIPDEKVIILLIAYVNIRLLSLSDEIHAARILQLAWKRKKLNQRLAQSVLEMRSRRLNNF